MKKKKFSHRVPLVNDQSEFPAGKRLFMFFKRRDGEKIIVILFHFFLLGGEKILNWLDKETRKKKSFFSLRSPISLLHQRTTIRAPFVLLPTSEPEDSQEVSRIHPLWKVK